MMTSFAPSRPVAALRLREARASSAVSQPSRATCLLSPRRAASSPRLCASLHRTVALHQLRRLSAGSARPSVAATAAAAAAAAAATEVRGVECSEWKALQAEGWSLLDVRPSDEVERVAVKGSINVPIFVVDEEVSFSNLLKQAAALGTGGWWQGGQHMKTNPSFVADVNARLPVDSNPAIVVACQKGLRSLAACEALVGAGYQRVAWLSGGFDSATKADFETNNGRDPRYGGVAGVRGMIGWTRVQQEEEKALGGGVFKFLGYIAVFTALNILTIVWQVYGEYTATGKLPEGLPRIF